MRPHQACITSKDFSCTVQISKLHPSLPCVSLLRLRQLQMDSSSSSSELVLDSRQVDADPFARSNVPPLVESRLQDLSNPRKRTALEVADLPTADDFVLSTKRTRTSTPPPSPLVESRLHRDLSENDGKTSAMQLALQLQRCVLCEASAAVQFCTHWLCAVWCMNGAVCTRWWW